MREVAMEWVNGLEPSNFLLGRQALYQLNYTHIYLAEGWNRTNNVTTTEIGIEPIWAITPLYHFSLSPYMQGTF